MTKINDDAPTVEAPTVTLEQACSVPEHLTAGCVFCGSHDADTDVVGWSVCRACFRADRFDGTAYWMPLWCGLLYCVGMAFLVGAVAVLAG